MLRLYEEMALLALDEQRGTFVASNTSFALAASLFAELLLEKRIAVEPSKKQLVAVVDATAVGDPLLDDCLQRMESAKRRAKAAGWITRWGSDGRLRFRVAERLCEQGILRADRVPVLWVFNRRIYPEVNPRPKAALRAKLEWAIFTESGDLDVRTIVLVSIADSAGVLTRVFDRKLLKERKERLKQICNGELASDAVREAIAEMEAAVAVAAMIPVMTGAVMGSGPGH